MSTGVSTARGNRDCLSARYRLPYPSLRDGRWLRRNPYLAGLERLFL